MSQKGATILVIISVILILSAVFLQQHVKRIDRQYGLYRDSEFFESVTTGFKKFVAQECWLQADVYLHQGLMHDPDEHCEICGSSTGEHHLEAHHHIDVQPDLFKPYNRKDFAKIKHQGGIDDKEIMPWLILTAYMDPKLTKAYANGGHWLAWRMSKPEDAIGFLEKGLKNNPGAPDILTELGMIYLDVTGKLGTKDLKKALDAFSKAIDSEEYLLNRLELMTYLAECNRALGNFKEAVEFIDAKVLLMKQHKMEDSVRLLNARTLRREILDEMNSTYYE